MLHDSYGLPLSTRSTAAVDHYNEGVERSRALQAGAEESLQLAIAADPGFALAYVALASALLLRGNLAEAKLQIAHARDFVGGSTAREQQHLTVIGATIEGDQPRGLGLAREHLAAYPRDALVLAAGVNLIGQGSRRDRHEEVQSLLNSVAPSYGDDWWFLGLQAFVLQELNRLDEARSLAQRSLDQYHRGGGAAHSLAHVFFESDEHAAGADFLGAWMADYDRQAPQHCHLSWHLALFELSAGHYRRAMQVFEADIRPALGHSRTAMYDAASLLWRLRLYGAAALPAAWEEVCSFARQAAAQPGVLFNAANAAFALSAAGDDRTFAQLVDGLTALAAQGHPTAGAVVLPLVQAVGAFGRGSYTETIALLEPVADQLVCIGGSNAQREVFEDTLLEAYLRSEQYEQAEALLRSRLQRRSSARDYFGLGRAAAGRGRSGEARSNNAEAQKRWASADLDAAELVAVEAGQRGAQSTPQ